MPVLHDAQWEFVWLLALGSIAALEVPRRDPPLLVLRSHIDSNQRASCLCLSDRLHCISMVRWARRDVTVYEDRTRGKYWPFLSASHSPKHRPSSSFRLRGVMSQLRITNDCGDATGQRKRGRARMHAETRRDGQYQVADLEVWFLG